MLITIVADTKKELDYKFDALKKRIEGQSMKIRRADFMMEECFDSCLLPLAKINKELAKKSHRNLLTSGVASCYPFISFEMQDPGGVMVGTNHVNNSLVTIDMFDTRAHANANAVILGSSGYGKTFTAQLFALRLSEMDTQVFIISPLKGLEDYGGGCKAVNGQFVSMDPSSDNNINIMDIRAPDDEDAKLLDDYEASGSFLTKKIHTILSFLHLVVRNMTQEEEQLIDGCLYATYAKFGITRDNNSIYDKDGNYKVMPLLEDLQEEMRKNPELHTVCNILNPLINGSMACFNHHTNVDLDSKYMVKTDFKNTYEAFMHCDKNKLAKEFAAMYSDNEEQAAAVKEVDRAFARMETVTPKAVNPDEQSIIVVCKGFGDEGDDTVCIEVGDLRNWKEKHTKKSEPISDEMLTFMSTDEIENAVMNQDLPTKYAFELSAWDEILSWKLAPSSIYIYGLEFCLSRVLWEMTFFGVDESGVELEKEKLDTRFEEAQRFFDENKEPQIGFSIEDIAKKLLGDDYTEDWYPEEEQERDRRNMVISSYIASTTAALFWWVDG